MNPNVGLEFEARVDYPKSLTEEEILDGVECQDAVVGEKLLVLDFDATTKEYLIGNLTLGFGNPGNESWFKVTEEELNNLKGLN